MRIFLSHYHCFSRTFRKS